MPQAYLSGALTTMDIASQMRSNPTLVAESRIIDLALERDDIVKDIIMVPASDGDTNVTTYRTMLPEAEFSRIYRGVRSSKGSWATSRNVAALCQSKMEIAKLAYEKAPDKDAFIRRHAASHVDALTMAVAQMLIYGNLRDNPDGFNGILKHYDRHTSNDDKVPAFTCINGGGTAHQQSILLAGWGGDSLYCFHPQGSGSGGISVSDMKPVDLQGEDDPTRTYEGLMQYFYWQLGLDLPDFRKSGRICNIDATKHQASSGLEDAAKLFFRNMDSLVARVDDRGTRQVLYMSKLVWEQAKIFAGVLTRSNAYTEAQLEGAKVRTLYGIPVHINDAMNVTEEAVTAAS